MGDLPPVQERGRGKYCQYQGLALPTSDNNLAVHALL